MPAPIGPFLVAAALLAIAGLFKLRSPDATSAALASAGLPSAPSIVRALGAAEVAIGTAAMLFGGPVLAALVAMLYAGFTGFVVAVRSAGSQAACGCFGAATTPPGLTHIVVNVAAMAAAATASLTRTPGLVEVVPEHPAQAAVVVGFVVVCTYMTIAVLTLLAPRATSMPREFQAVR